VLRGRTTISTMKKDPRIGQIIQQIVRFSKGNFNGYIKISDKIDEIDGISAGLNALGDLLNNREDSCGDTKEQVRSVSKHAQASESVFKTDAVRGSKSSSQNLQLDAALFNAIYQNAPYAIVVMNSRQYVVEWNRAAQKTFGWSNDDVNGKSLVEILVPERLRTVNGLSVQNSIKKNITDKSLRTFRFPALSKSDEEIEVEITIASIGVSDRDYFIGFINECSKRATDLTSTRTKT
jgi:PAS domain S-box-containing protein